METVTETKPLLKAYLIDPRDRTIVETTYDYNIKTIQSAVGGLFDVARFDPETGDTVYVDDEGLYNQPHYFFAINGYPQPLAGKGFVLGCNMETGESRSTIITLERLKQNVMFFEVRLPNGVGFLWVPGRQEPELANINKLPIKDALL